MRVWGLEVPWRRRRFWWRREFLTRSYWRDLRAACRRTQGRPGDDLGKMAERINENFVVERVKRHALDERCTECREHLTNLARRGDADVARWLIDNGLVGPEAL